MALAIVLAATAGVHAFAQRGVGTPAGVARGLDVETALISGMIVDAKVSRCPQTTGRGLVGAHIVVETLQAETVDLHLGPITDVGDLLEGAPDGAAVEALAFRSGAMPKDAFAAITVTIDGKTTNLRDDATLRPVWAAGRAAGAGAGTGWRTGQGLRQSSATAQRGWARGGCWWAETVDD